MRERKTKQKKNRFEKSNKPLVCSTSISKKVKRGIFSWATKTKQNAHTHTHTRAAQQIYRKSWLNPSQCWLIFFFAIPSASWTVDVLASSSNSSALKPLTCRCRHPQIQNQPKRIFHNPKSEKRDQFSIGFKPSEQQRRPPTNFISLQFVSFHSKPPSIITRKSFAQTDFSIKLFVKCMKYTRSVSMLMF